MTLVLPNRNALQALVRGEARTYPSIFLFLRLFECVQMRRVR